MTFGFDVMKKGNAMDFIATMKCSTHRFFLDFSSLLHPLSRWQRMSETIKEREQKERERKE